MSNARLAAELEPDVCLEMLKCHRLDGLRGKPPFINSPRCRVMAATDAKEIYHSPGADIMLLYH